MKNKIDSRPDPSDIIEQYNKRKVIQPVFCQNCGVGEMKRTGKRTSASVNYIVWNCNRCNFEKLEFSGLDSDAERVLNK